MLAQEAEVRPQVGERPSRHEPVQDMLCRVARTHDQQDETANISRPRRKANVKEGVVGIRKERGQGWGVLRTGNFRFRVLSLRLHRPTGRDLESGTRFVLSGTSTFLQNLLCCTSMAYLLSGFGETCCWPYPKSSCFLRQ